MLSDEYFIKPERDRKIRAKLVFLQNKLYDMELSKRDTAKIVSLVSKWLNE